MRPVYVRLWVRTLRWLEGPGRRCVILSADSKDINTDVLLDLRIIQQSIKSTTTIKVQSPLHILSADRPCTRCKQKPTCSSPSSPSSLRSPLPLRLPTLPPTAQLLRLPTHLALVPSPGRLVQPSPSLEELHTWPVQLLVSSSLVALLWYVSDYLDKCSSSLTRN